MDDWTKLTQDLMEKTYGLSLHDWIDHADASMTPQDFVDYLGAKFDLYRL